MVASHEPGVKTVFRPNPNWWGKAEHNLDEVVFQTISRMPPALPPCSRATST